MSVIDKTHQRDVVFISGEMQLCYKTLKLGVSYVMTVSHIIHPISETHQYFLEKCIGS